MTNNPAQKSVLFSIIIPLYNKENEIAKTINSVLEQKFSNYEIIIVNDGSTDNSLNMLDKFNDKRIKIINRKNGGVSSARNTGILAAKGLYVAFLDADDIWLPDYLCEINSLIDKYDNCYIFGTNYTLSSLPFNQKSNTVYRHTIVSNYFELAMHVPFLHTSAVVVKRDCFDNEIKFNEKLTHGEDLDLWSRLFKKYKSIGYSNRKLVYYNRSAQESACSKIPEPKKQFAFHLKLKGIKGTIEYRYNLHQITAFSWLYLKHYKIYYLFVMLSKHKRFIPQIIPELLKQIINNKYKKVSKFK